jgi:hypothetical protein
MSHEVGKIATTVDGNEDNEGFIFFVSGGNEERNLKGFDEVSCKISE